MRAGSQRARSSDEAQGARVGRRRLPGKRTEEPRKGFSFFPLPPSTFSFLGFREEGSEEALVVDLRFNHLFVQLPH